MNFDHEIIFAGDCDKRVKESYFANYEITEEKWHNDVTSFSAEKYKGKLDLLVGGSPCQSFSIVGKLKGLEDTRGTLFYDFARVVSEAQPKVFIYENVKGLTTHDKGKTFKIIQEVLESLGYTLHYKILNSKDYGVPQTRARIFCVGFKTDVDFHFPKEIELKTTMQDYLEDFIDSDYYDHKTNCKIIGEHIFPVKEVEEKYYIAEKTKKYILSEGTKNFKSKPKTDSQIAKTLLQTMHKMHRAGVDNYVTHNQGRLRKLTPRECLRLMGFREDFKIVVSNSALYRQAGNSIVVDVLIALLGEILKVV